jgi:hypothetical protein
VGPVKLFALNDDGLDVQVGILSLEGGKVVPHPDTPRNRARVASWPN